MVLMRTWIWVVTLPHLVWGESRRSVSEEVAVVTCSVRNGVIG